MRDMNFFDSIKQADPDPILRLTSDFQADPREKKVNLGVGVYKTEDLSPLILHSVKLAEERLLQKETSKDYLPIDGFQDYVVLTKNLVFGESLDRVRGVQTVGATAALRVGGEFLKLHTNSERVYLPDPTWVNHKRIFLDAGLEVHSYPYFDRISHKLDYDRLRDALYHMQSGSVVLFHGCCHNPTGMDPSLEQWQDICSVAKERELLPFFDFSYQGFGNNLQQDARAVRLFMQSGMQYMVAVSHSKNFGLYAERTGALFCICTSNEESVRVGSVLNMIVRGIYTSPPCHGARIVTTILQDESLRGIWMEELANIRDRITSMRKKLVSLLKLRSSKFDFMATQNGMFSYTCLNPDSAKKLTAEFGIYLPSDGRINVAGLNEKNVEYVADAIIRVSL